MTQNGNNDIMMDVIRAIDTIRTRAHALSQGLRESGHFRVLMLQIETDGIRMSLIRDTYK